MKRKSGIIIFAFIEILIGSVTLIAVILSLIEGRSTKSPSVLVFVLLTATLSLILGFGVLKRILLCYRLLLYFSAIVILGKILIFSGIITLSGALETGIPSTLKNTLSIIYHMLLIFYFTRRAVRDEFIKDGDGK